MKCDLKRLSYTVPYILFWALLQSHIQNPNEDVTVLSSWSIKSTSAEKWKQYKFVKNFKNASVLVINWERGLKHLVTVANKNVFSDWKT